MERSSVSPPRWPGVHSPHRPTGANTKYRHTVVSPATEDPELELRARFIAGDDEVLKDLYNEHGASVYTFAKRALGAEAARDLTQEVFLSAWRARSSFDATKGSLGGWLMGITKNRLVDTYRKAGRRVDEAELSEPVQQRAASEDHNRFGLLADRMVLTTALNTLPERQRHVLTMAFWGDLTQQQIAEDTNMPLGTVKSDMRRGLLQLRKELERSNV